MQPYFGSLEALNRPKNAEALKRQHSPLDCPTDILKIKQKGRVKTYNRKETQPNQVQSFDHIKVNASGKYLYFSQEDLARYPKSLLSDESQRRKFFDPNKNEYFLDHNRVIAQSVHDFYLYGILSRPENIPEYLFVEEIGFYGLQEHLDEDSKQTLRELQTASPCRSTSQDWRDKLSSILESPDVEGKNWCARAYNIFSLAMILLSIFLLCYDSHSGGLQTSSTAYFDNISQKWVFLSELICIGYFTVELFLRFIVSHDKRRFCCRFLNFVDFIAIVPFYTNLFLNIHHITAPLSVLRVLRIGKTFRVLKISKYNTSLLIIGKTLHSGRWDLWMLCFLLVITCVFFGSITYFIEDYFVPDTEFQSIPASIWWALITTLTIGYGSMAPQSSVGRLSGALCAISGVIILAPILPIIFGRWTRFNQLHSEAKIHKKCKRLNMNIQKDIEHLNLIRVQSSKQKGRFFF